VGNLNDPAIRAMLHAALRAGGLVPRDEIPISIAVVDVLGVSPLGIFHGFEIKSDVDSLARLSTQVKGYGLVLDLCTIVTGARHEARAAAMVPAWWGLWRATADGIVTIRDAQPNPTPAGERAHRLGWPLRHVEAAALCERHECARGVRGRSCLAMVQRLRSVLGDDAFRQEVAATLAARRTGPDAHKETVRSLQGGT